MMKSTVRWTFILVGTAAYFALAVIGRGGLAAFFSHPPLIALAIALFALSGVALFAGGNVSPGVREDRGNRWVLVAFGVLGLLGLPICRPTRTASISGPSTAIPFDGLAFFSSLPAVLLRIWPVFVLGNRFSGLVAIQPGHTLVTSGMSTVSSAIPATWGCSSTRWDGAWRFVRGSACC